MNNIIWWLVVLFSGAITGYIYSKGGYSLEELSNIRLSSAIGAKDILMVFLHFESRNSPSHSWLEGVGSLNRKTLGFDLDYSFFVFFWPALQNCSSLWAHHHSSYPILEVWSIDISARQ